MLTQNKKIRGLGSWLAVALLVALSMQAMALAPHPANSDASALYIVSQDAYVHVQEPVDDIFFTDGSSALVSRGSGAEVSLAAGQPVVIHYQEETVTSVAHDETVAQLLARLGVQTSPLEMVAVSIQEQLVEIRVASEFVFYEQISTVAEHEIVYQYNSELPAWKETVLQEGRDGEYSEVYEVIYQDGQETARQLIDVVDVEPVPTIIEKGTIENFAQNDTPVSSISTNADGSGTITLANGEVLTFSESRSMKGTAYTTGGKVGSITASGTQVHVGVVAVDRDVLPLGTKVYVAARDGSYVYGFAVAEDTGVHGNIIDLYMDSYSECIDFGVRNCDVYILD